MEREIIGSEQIVADRALAGGSRPWSRLRELFERRPFLRDVSIMLTGTTGGQMFGILLSPILTRLYSPQQFGILSVYLAILSILVVVAALRYELTLPLATTEVDAINLTAICVCGLAITTTVVGISAFAIPKATIEGLWLTPLSSLNLMTYRALLPAGFFCLGGYYIALYMATRAGAFRSIAMSRLGQGLVGPLSQIAMAAMGAGAPGLLIGSILGQSAGTFGLLQRVMSTRKELLKAISWRKMMHLAGRYRRFPLIASWTAVLDAAGSNQLLYLLVSTQYSTVIAGFLFLIERVVARPLSMVGTSILQVFVGEAGQTATSDPRKLKRRFRQIVVHQFYLAVAWVVFANLAAAAFFPAAFGKNWDGAIIYLQAMSLGYLAQAIVLPVFHTLQLLEQQVTAAAWQVSRVVLTVAIFAIGAHFNAPALSVIWGYSIASAASCLILLFLMERAIQRLQRDMQ